MRGGTCRHRVAGRLANIPTCENVPCVRSLSRVSGVLRGPRGRPHRLLSTLPPPAHTRELWLGRAGLRWARPAQDGASKALSLRPGLPLARSPLRHIRAQSRSLLFGTQWPRTSVADGRSSPGRISREPPQPPSDATERTLQSCLSGTECLCLPNSRADARPRRPGGEASAGSEAMMLCAVMLGVLEFRWPKTT